MLLQEYLRREGLRAKDFALVAKVARYTIERWVKGELIPAPGLMRRVIVLTRGLVLPNDFFAATIEEARLCTDLNLPHLPFQSPKSKRGRAIGGRCRRRLR